jgi:hypothetical protein
MLVTQTLFWTIFEGTMRRLLAFMVGLCLAGSALAQSPQDHLTRRQWIDQQHAQSRQKQFYRSHRQLKQQQQLNQERFRAEHGWQLHTRPQAPWMERQRGDALRNEFSRTP